MDKIRKYELSTDIMQPVINNNGDNKDVLIQRRLEACDAITAAMAKVVELIPHGRNYIHNRERFDVDVVIYRQRFAILDAMYQTLMDEAIHLKNQGE